jgi:hypothetical protein
MKLRTWIAVAMLLAAGCREDRTVRVYSAPKDPRWRLMASLVPAADATWFFKLSAPSARLAEVKGEVEAFFATLAVEGGDVRWTLPAGWREEKGKAGDRVATLSFGKTAPAFELSVTKLGGAAGGPLANVNRWRGQLGLSPLGEAELPANSAPLSGGGLRVDFEGPKRPSMAPPMAGGDPVPPPPPPSESADNLNAAREMFAYAVPSGWIQNPKPGPMRLFEFGAGEALVSFTIIQGDGGDLVANVNRWRGQVGLSPLDPASAAGALQPFEFVGNPGYLADIAGHERSMVLIFRLGPPFAMFLKMEGPKSTVLKEKPAFEAFARSVRVNR